MSTKFKVGEHVRIRHQSIQGWIAVRNIWWTDRPYKVTDTFIVQNWSGYNWRLIHPTSGRTLLIAQSDLELDLPPLSKEELILQKIKYLNKRYMERKYATV